MAFLSIYSVIVARPVTISDEQILEAARAVFVKDGMGASTVEIARIARVSEGTIFRRFTTKEALFRAAVRPPQIPDWVRELDTRVGTGDLRVNLIHIAREIIRLSQQIMPLVMRDWGHPPSVAAAGPDPSEQEESPINRDRRRLAQFLQQEIDRGRLRSCCDVEVVARMLFDPCLGVVVDSILQKQPLARPDVDCFAQSLVEALWEGVAPAPVPPSAQPS